MPAVAPNDDIDYDALVRRTRAGDLTAFEAIVRRLERPLRAWLATHVSPGVDVDEIAKRSFVIAHSQLERFKPGTNFPAWLFAIARFQLKAELTRLRRVADYHVRFAPDLLQRESDSLLAFDAEPGNFVKATAGLIQIDLILQTVH